MTTLDTSDLLTVPPKRPGLFAAIFQAIERNRLWHARQRALIQLSHYDAHMLRDMGIDPRDVEDAFNRRSVSVLMYPMRPKRQ